MELIVRRLETEEDLTAYRKWYTFPGRGMIANLVIPLKQCAFPAPGR